MAKATIATKGRDGGWKAVSWGMQGERQAGVDRSSGCLVWP
jgi:hypothetical protein